LWWLDTVKRILDQTVVWLAFARVVDRRSCIVYHDTSKSRISLVCSDQVIGLGSSNVVAIIRSRTCLPIRIWSSDQTNEQLSVATLSTSNRGFPGPVVQVDFVRLDMSAGIVGVVICPVSSVTSISCVVVKLNEEIIE
jgi:hypothetical protein